MKRIIAVCAGMLLCSIATAAPHGSVKSFEENLASAIAPCSEMGFKNIQAGSEAIVAGTDAIIACKDQSKLKGAELYKAFIANVKDAQFKTDAKSMFSAWIAYVGIVTGSLDEGDSREFTAYRLAASTLETDELTAQ